DALPETANVHALAELPDAPVLNRHAVMSGAVVDTVRRLVEEEVWRKVRAVDHMATEVQRDVSNADDNPGPRAIDQVAVQCRVLSDHVAAPDVARACGAGAQREKHHQGERRQDG